MLLLLIWSSSQGIGLVSEKSNSVQQEEVSFLFPQNDKNVFWKYPGGAQHDPGEWVDSSWQSCRSNFPLSAGFSSPLELSSSSLKFSSSPLELSSSSLKFSSSPLELSSSSLKFFFLFIETPHFPTGFSPLPLSFTSPWQRPVWDGGHQQRTREIWCKYQVLQYFRCLYVTIANRLQVLTFYQGDIGRGFSRCILVS